MPKKLPKNNALKKYFLSQEEKENILGRKKFVEYTIDLVNRDINMYLGNVVFQRLDLPMGTKVELAPDCSFLVVFKEKSEIIIPKSGIVLPTHGKN